jgi:hypothetical protein
MGMVRECGKESKNLINIFRYIRFRSRFHVDHPEYFEADGLLAFVGPQGSGKTLSAVNYVYQLLEMYPKAKLCTNLLLHDYPIVTFEDYKGKKKEFIEQLKQANQGENETKINSMLWNLYLKENRVFLFSDNDDFVKYSNGENGLIYLVDEIQLYLNSLQSKNINLDTVTQISQQRKQRKHIVATSQVFGRMAKPLREQFSNVILCKNYIGCIQKNSLIDRDSLENETSSDTQVTGKVKQNFYWIHNPDIMYKRYDTYYVIEKGKFVSGESQQREGVYNDNNIKLSINN